MRYDKKKYEKLIYESPLFEIDKDRQSSTYRKESLKMVEYLYCYLLAINTEKYEKYGCEIVEVARRCINGYDKTGDFLHYFKAAWKKEYSHICGDEIVDNKFQGMKLSQQEKREVKKYMRLFSKCNLEQSKDNMYKTIAELMDLSVERVILLAEVAETKVVSGYSSNKEGEEYSVFDQLADSFSVEGYFDNSTSLGVMLDGVEHFYGKLQERQKPIVADLITIKIGADLLEINELKKKYSFISEDICKSLSQTGKVPTQRDIAEKYGKNEASISRTWKEFLKKIRDGDFCMYNSGFSTEKPRKTGGLNSY